MPRDRSPQQLREFLEGHYRRYHRVEFIESDPISIPHRFSQKQDIEIAAFWTAMLSWGNRRTIIDKASLLMDLMDNAPFEFVTLHQPQDRKRFSSWKHRTFQYTDTIYFLEFFQKYYAQHQSLEDAFLTASGDLDLGHFHRQFFSLADVPQRTRKHVATPIRGSRCKRICMFLRWMVRPGPVDFGIWTSIDPSRLLCPLDVHVERVARQLGLLKRAQADWKAVLELTDRLKGYDPRDPVKYDFALFGIGVEGVC